jgi:nitrogen regulatory protein P-II 1
MKKVEAVIKPFKLDEVREALVGLGIEGMSVSEVKARDPHARSARYRGTEYVVSFAPEIKLEVVVPDQWVAPCINAIQHVAVTDHDDCGEIVVLQVEDMIRIRTGEHLARAA